MTTTNTATATTATATTATATTATATTATATTAAQYNAAIKAAAEWEFGVEIKYCDDDILTIMGLLSYLENIELENIECGFGHLTEKERQEDSNGELYIEAMRGFSLSKKYIHLRKVLKRERAAAAKLKYKANK
jgi:hypothetical protein